MPIISLRNVDTTKGVCNGTRLICKRIHSKILECEIATGINIGRTVYIQRMPLTPTDTNLPFDFKRIQFPVRPAFSMTISKSQGQTLALIGLALEEPPYAHGHLYVSFSRVSAIENIKVCIKNNSKYTRNLVYKEVLI